MALLLVQLGPQTAEILGILGLVVDLTGLALSDTLIVVQALTVLLSPALDIPDRFVRWWGCGREGVRRTRSGAVLKSQLAEFLEKIFRFEGQ